MKSDNRSKRGVESHVMPIDCRTFLPGTAGVSLAAPVLSQLPPPPRPGGGTLYPRPDARGTGE